MTRMGLLALALGVGPALAQGPSTTSCVTCHFALEGGLARPAQLIKDDVHIKNGLSCASCHGGDPSTAEMAESMSPRKGFIGKIERRRIPELCGGCHSDAVYMRRFKPQQRVDQLALYKTSIHGQRLSQGDAAVAVCVDCHSVHDIREVKDVLSPVYPSKTPETCGRCHSDPARMKNYQLPTDQLEKYQKSVHWDALSRKSDLAAPVCSTCHGSHGATPSGVETVARACGSCHVVFQDLFDRSPHKTAYDALGLPGCVVCHENHEIRKPNIAMLGVTETAVCVRCHTQGDPGYLGAQAMRKRMDELQASLRSAEEIVARAERSGMEMSEARLQLASAGEELVKARVQVHQFQPAALDNIVNVGVAASRKSYELGVAQLRERDVRRWGLLASLLTILVTILGLWLVIRRNERTAPH